MGYVEQLLSKGEVIVVRSRQHWIALVASALTNGFIFIVSVVLGIFLNNQLLNASINIGNIDLIDLVARVIQIAAVVGMAYAVFRFGWEVLQWWSEEYLITDRRVLQTEGIINKRTSDSALEKVNDVVLVQSFFGRLLGYGDLEVVTGSDIGVNSLTRLRDAVTFKTAMLDQIAALGGRHAERPSDEVADRDVPKLIAELDALRKQGLISDAEFNDKKAKLLSQL